MAIAKALSLIWCCCVGLLFGATNEGNFPNRFVVKSWGTEAGLPQNSVNAILQTRDGYLWLGTQGGLARFDGVRFKVFGLAEGLPSIQVLALHEDRDGQLWVGTLGGISRMRNGGFETISYEPGLADIFFVTFAEDAENRLWIGTSAGLVLWQDGKVVQLAALSALEHIRIRGLLRLRSGAMWIATGSEVFEFKDGKLSEIIGPPGVEKISLHTMLEDTRGNVWVSIGNGKVLCRRSDGWFTYNESFGLPFAYITSLAETDDGTVWAGSLDDGLYFLQDGRFQVVREKDGLSGDAIRSLFADQEGHLWVGTRSAGLNRLTQKQLRTFGAEAGLTNEFVRGLAESADGTLWVATIGGGMYRGSQGRFESVPSIVGAITFPSFDSVVALRDGSIWWGGVGGSLFQWKNNEIVTNYTRLNTDWLVNATVTALREDVRDGFWIGTTRGKLLRMQNGEFEAVSNRVAGGAVTALEQDKDGTLWIGSVAGGLVRMGREGISTFSTTNGLLSNEIRTLHRDEDGTLWIGTGGGGLGQLKNGRLKNFTTLEGLGDDTVSQILEDDRGRLWLGCNRGIFRVDKKELDDLADGKIKFIHCRAFGVSEGMPVEECSGGFSPAGLKTKSGKLCFSTHKGVVLLDPDEPERDARPPNVLIEEVWVEGSNITHSAGSPVTAVTIPPGRRDIEFHYTGLSFMSPSKVQFRYRLKDYDREWNEVTRRAAYYPRIPPGSYVFEVTACNANNAWAKAATTLGVTVQPYFWETSWFPALTGLVVLGGIAGSVQLIARQRYKRRLAQLETRHAIERERLRISQDMHDDIGSILTRVSILSDVGQGETDPTKAAPQFERIGTQVRAAVVALDEIVWATNPGDDNLPRFAEYVGRFADECFENSPVRCWQEMPTDLPKRSLRADIRHNVFLAIKEALNNVLKHSGASEVWLRLKLLDSSVRVEVEDNGRGFVADSAPVAGNGLRNMHSRLAECGGRLELASAPGKGTRIRFIFPLPKND